MRLVYVASSFPYGQNDTFFAAEVRELVRQGVDVVVVPVRPRGALTTPDAEARALRRPLVDRTIVAAAVRETLRAPREVASALRLVLSCPTPSVLVRNLAGFPKALWLARTARALGADHIHAHWAGPPSTVAMLASRLSGIPWSFTAHAAEIEANNLLRQKFASAAFVRFVACAMMDLARLIVPGCDDSRWALVRIGVEIPAEWRLPETSTPVVLVAARFGPEKGHATLVDAIDRLGRDGVVADVVLAGSGPREAEIRRLVSSRNLDRRVHFLGYVPNPVLLGRLRAGEVDVVALPSDSEGLPVSLVESLACGVPAVASNVGGVSELLGDGCGLLVPVRDGAALAHALRRLLESRELRAACARAGRARVEREYAVDVVVQRLRELMEGAQLQPR